MKIKKVSIQAFRAYNNVQDGTFDFSKDGNPSDFVALYAPNGFGKSSFYDAVEWAFTRSIGRYVRAASKVNNTKAADNSKSPDAPQLILRNHDAPSNKKTVVKVDTTRGEFKRRLSVAADGSRDFSFQGNVAQGREAFRDIFLSQDGIDAFIRESKPADRYERFMDSFGQEAELTRKRLHALRFENSQVLGEINEKITELHLALDQPLDLRAFEQYNLAVGSLGDEGEKLKISETNFDIASEANLKFLLGELTQQFIRQAAEKKLSIEDLQQLATDLSAAQLAEKAIANNAEHFSTLSTAVQKSRKHKELLIQLDADQAGLTQLNTKLAELVAIIQSLPAYQDIQIKISIAEQALANTSQELVGKEATQRSLLASLEDLSSKINAAEADLNSWRLYEDAVKLSFKNIIVDAENLKQVTKNIENVKIQLTAKNLSQQLLADRAGKLSVTGLDRHNIITSVVGLVSIPEDASLRLSVANRAIEQADSELVKNSLALKSINDQSGLFGQLVALGQALIQEHRTSNCPLCTHQYGSHEELLGTIAQNDAIPSLQRHLQQQGLQFTSHREVALNEAEKIVRAIQSLLDETLSSTRASSAELLREIGSLDANLAKLSGDKAQIENRLNSARTHTLNMDEAALAAHIISQIRIIEGNKAAYASNRAGDELRYNQSRTSIAELTEKISGFNTSLSALKTQPVFVSVSNYMVRVQWLQEADLGTLSERARAQLISEIARSEVSIRAIADESSELQTWMKQSGTWLRDAEIEQDYANTYHQRTANLELVSSYKKRLSEMFQIVFIEPLERVESLLTIQILQHTNAIAALEQKQSVCFMLQTQLPALMPYIEHLAHKRDLLPLEVLKVEHESLHLILEAEINNAIDYLVSRISGFFYDKLINEIYKKIDPHPNFKTVEFIPTFSQDERPGLHIVVIDENNKRIPPTLYFSAAQLNILSLSIFLAKAIHATYEGEPLDVIFIDDPMHSMDSINILSTIDLLRNISRQLNKQIIISTHDENFYQLLQKKIPAELGSKFLKLESYGVVRVE